VHKALFGSLDNLIFGPNLDVNGWMTRSRLLLALCARTKERERVPGDRTGLNKVMWLGVVLFITGKAFGLLTIAMVVRLIVTFLVVSGNNLSIRDKIFVAIAWSPKATVQVRMGFRICRFRLIICFKLKVDVGFFSRQPFPDCSLPCNFSKFCYKKDM